MPSLDTGSLVLIAITLFAAFQTDTWQEWEIIHTISTNTAT